MAEKLSEASHTQEKLMQLMTLASEVTSRLNQLVIYSSRKAAAAINEPDMTKSRNKHAAYNTEHNNEINHLSHMYEVLGSLIENQNASTPDDDENPTVPTTINGTLWSSRDQKAPPGKVEAAPPTNAGNQIFTPSTTSKPLMLDTRDKSEYSVHPASEASQFQENSHHRIIDPSSRALRVSEKGYSVTSARNLKKNVPVPHKDTIGESRVKASGDIIHGSDTGEDLSQHISISRQQKYPSQLSPKVKDISAKSLQLSSTEGLVFNEPKRVTSGTLLDRAREPLTHARISANQQRQIRAQSPRIRSQVSKPNSSDTKQRCFTPQTLPLATNTPNTGSLRRRFAAFKESLNPLHGSSSNEPSEAHSHHLRNSSVFPGDTPAKAASLKKLPNAFVPISKFPDPLVTMLASVNDWRGFVSHVISPSEFYFHVAGAGNETIDDFHDGLNNFYSSDSSDLCNEGKQAVYEMVGNFCACFFHNGWYRAQVLDWNSHLLDEVEIQLVDYGNKFMANLSDIRPLASEFAKRPLFATRCHLSYLMPPQSCKEWPSTATTILKKHLNLESVEKVFTISPTSKEEIPPYSSLHSPNMNHDKSVPVILLSDDGKETVNDYLITIEFAEFDKQMKNRLMETMMSKCQAELRLKEMEESRRKVEEWCTKEKVVAEPERPPRMPSPDFRMGAYSAVPKAEPPPPDEMNEWDPMTEDYENAKTNDEDACVAVMGYAPTDETRVCHLFTAKGHCPWGNRCRREHVLPNIHSVTTDREEVFASAFKEMPSQRNGQPFFITVSSAQGGSFYAIKIDFIKALEDLCDSINTPANVAAYKRLKVAPALCQIVLAKFSKDGRFYRGRVIDGVDSNMKVLVTFVDFGHWELVPEKDLREIKPQFLHLPFQSIKCSFANVQLFKETYDEVSEFLVAKYVIPCVLQAVVVSSDASSLYLLVIDKDDNDVGEILVRNGFGSLVDIDDVIRFAPGSIMPG